MTLYTGSDASLFVSLAIGIAQKKPGITMADMVQDQRPKIVPMTQANPVLFDGTPSLWTLKV